MQLFWRGSWIAVPGYETPDPAVLVEVHAAVPITRLENPSGRAARQPLRKAVIFLVTDGPRSTLRKIRAKRQEQLFTGDFHITVLFGRAVTSQ
ncbi:MAG: hypothetical protein J2P50_20370, partial [Hyphomicrobiaceae bacterium]|nr:hypothetical protein [Hyphomicrobiaceae bacterium]